MCGAIYICNTQQKFNKRKGGNLSDLLRLLKKGRKIFICCPFRIALQLYYVTYRPTQFHAVQISKSVKPDWCN